MWNCFSSKKMSALLQRMLHSCKYFKFPAEFPANQIVFEACIPGVVREQICWQIWIKLVKKPLCANI